jgi:hypothetical protein
MRIPITHERRTCPIGRPLVKSIANDNAGINAETGNEFGVGAAHSSVAVATLESWLLMKVSMRRAAKNMLGSSGYEWDVPSATSAPLVISNGPC